MTLSFENARAPVSPEVLTIPDSPKILPPTKSPLQMSKVDDADAMFIMQRH